MTPAPAIAAPAAVEWLEIAGRARVTCGDAVAALRSLPDGCLDSVVSDPPYAEVSRQYGRLSEADWMDLMQAVTLECRRVLKPRGSAVFILQPNFERLGKMRLWLWRYMLWAAEEWNIVQDAYWWNFTTMPGAGVQREIGLLRGSVKTCVWVGPPDCYRNQDAVLWRESDSNMAQRLAYRAGESHSGVQPSGHSRDRGKLAGTAARRFPEHPSGHQRDKPRISGAALTRDYSRPSGRDFDDGVMRSQAGSRIYRPSGNGTDPEKHYGRAGECADPDTGRGYVTPFNLLPFANSDSQNSAGAHGHGAGTPIGLCRWWVRYLTPLGPDYVTCDPFMGTGTVGLAALEDGWQFIGSEKEPAYFDTACARLRRAAQQPTLSLGGDE